MVVVFSIPNVYRRTQYGCLLEYLNVLLRAVSTMVLT